MSHGLTKKDSMFSYHEVPWHGLGAVLQRRPRSVADALKKAGLDWKIEQRPIYIPETKTTKRAVDGFMANVRSDTGDVLGVVTDKYEVVQNDECFGFLANLLGSELHFETAGSLFEGRRVWVLAEVPEHITVGGDAIRRYVLISTHHDGTGSVKARPTAIRVVCNNTLTAAENVEEDVYVVRHTANASQQLAEARAVMRLTLDYYKQFAKFGDKLAMQKMPERKLEQVLQELYPVDSAMGGRAVKNSARARDAVRSLFTEGVTVGNAPGSKWCAYNAIVEHHDHNGRVRSAQGQFVRAFEDPSGFKRRALREVIAA